MLLTAAAVVVGSSVMLFDPIFQGLAVSLIFGEVAATILSRFAVPVLYFWMVGKSRVKYVMEKAKEEEI
jgi:multidrug efflux pump subunit AcrB